MVPAEASPAGGEYKTFGWQGINLTVPAAWDLVFTQGRHQSGYVRLADEDATRLELRWDASRQAGPPADTVTAYLKKLAKRARKQGRDFSSQRGLKLASPPEKQVECYRWATDRQGMGMMSRCTACGRAVHLQLLGGLDEALKGLARTVFASLRDHSDGGVHLWSFFDVEFRSPAGFGLLRHGLQAGCIRMLFGQGRTRLEFIRVSLAQVVLGQKGLAEWFPRFYAKALKRRSYAVREAELRGHAGIVLEGRPWLLVNPLRLFGRRRSVRAVVWHCEETNRLFACCFDGPESEVGILSDAVDGFRCCERAPGAR